MSFQLSPVGNEIQIDSDGNPLSGGMLETYIASTLAPANTYHRIYGLVPQSNPIILNTLGLVSSIIWLDSTLVYKFIIKDASGVALRTIDNISGISSEITAQDQWIIYDAAITFITATSFSVANDQTAIFSVGRRVRTTNTGGVVYSTITAVAFSAGVTTVTVSNDSGVLDSGLSQVSYGLVSFEDTSFDPIIKGSVKTWFQAAAPLGWTQVVTQNNKAFRIVSGAGGGAAGSVSFTTAFALQSLSGTTNATTLTAAQIPQHTHNITGFSAAGDSGMGLKTSNLGAFSASPSTDGGSGGGGSHTHTWSSTSNVNLDVQYIDMILASKD